MSVNVAGESIAIATPPGFCIDREGTRNTSQGAFVFASDCSLLGASETDRAPVGALLTASVLADERLVAEGSDTTLDDLAAFLQTTRGRALLSRSGDAGRTRILQTQTSGDVLFVLVEDRGRQPLPGVEPRFWRAFLVVRGRLTALSVQGFEGTGMGGESGLRHAAAFAQAIRTANGRRA
jgi:hypothetical protein